MQEQKPKNKYGHPVNVKIHCPKCTDQTRCMTQAFGNPCFCLNCFGYGNSECCEETCPMLEGD
jgi:hypothetical protein